MTYIPLSCELCDNRCWRYHAEAIKPVGRLKNCHLLYEVEQEIKEIEEKYNVKVHGLKTWPELFSAVIEPDMEKRKHLELRLNDRDYQVGDYLYLREYNPDKKEYTGRYAWRLVTHIVKDLPHLTEHYVAMSIIEKEPVENMSEYQKI